MHGIISKIRLYRDDTAEELGNTNSDIVELNERLEVLQKSRDRLQSLVIEFDEAIELLEDKQRSEDKQREFYFKLSNLENTLPKPTTPTSDVMDAPLDKRHEVV